MKFPNHGGFITSLLKYLGEGQLAEIKFRPKGIVYKSIFVTVFPGENGSPGRAAN